MRKVEGVLLFLALGAAGPVMAQSIQNGGFDLSVPSNGSSHGWISADIDSSGGWRNANGNPGGVFILNSGGLLITDPMLAQVLTGLEPGQAYLIQGQYASWYFNSRPVDSAAFIAKIDSQTTFVGSTGALHEWRDFSFVFIANAPTATVTFQGEAYGTDNDFALDNISIVRTDCAPCPADYDFDGSVTMGDLAAFFTTWQEGEACADVDQDGGVDAFDIWRFLGLFEAGGC